MVCTSIHAAKQNQNAVGAKELQGALIVLGELLGQGKKCLTQALQRVKSQLERVMHFVLMLIHWQ
jgi:hypothetical protein